MAAVTILGASCAKESTDTSKAPITKPEITIEGGRLTPEGLWAMGRIGSVKSDIETGLLAYTVSYYSVEENRSTTWIRICNPFENMQVVDEFVGSEPAWFGNSGALAYLKGGKLYIRRDKEEVEVEGTEDVEGFLLSPMRDQVILIKQVVGDKDFYPWHSEQECVGVLSSDCQFGCFQQVHDFQEPCDCLTSKKQAFYLVQLFGVRDFVAGLTEVSFPVTDGAFVFLFVETLE